MIEFNTQKMHFRNTQSNMRMYFLFIWKEAKRKKQIGWNRSLFSYFHKMHSCAGWVYIEKYPREFYLIVDFWVIVIIRYDGKYNHFGINSIILLCFWLFFFFNLILFDVAFNVQIFTYIWFYSTGSIHLLFLFLF